MVFKGVITSIENRGLVVMVRFFMNLNLQGLFKTVQSLDSISPKNDA